MRTLYRFAALASTVVTAAATAMPAAAAPAAASNGAGASAATTVIVELAPTNLSALNRLARARNLPAHERAARLAALTPTPPTRRAVAAKLREFGLTVTGADDWTLRATGQADDVRAVFGDAPAGHGPRAYPGVPPSLAAAVTAAFPVGGTPAWRPHTTPQTRTGYDFRSAYDGPSAVDAPSLGAGLTIATIQFSGWNPGDLDAFATSFTDYGFATAPSRGQYSSVSIDGASATKPDGFGGEVEVALDQEVLLSTAPRAGQRAYFAPNDAGAGYVDALHQIAKDAAGHHIAALSMSWGGCIPPHPTTADKNLYTTMDLALKMVAAAGVTSFAASGDTGSSDCTDGFGNPIGPATVDYPAASPYAIGVGGTTLPNNPATATAWHEADGSASGGGMAPASIEKRPDWQSTIGATTSGRFVPDIASDAAGANGFVIDYTPDGDTRTSGVIGGTSLASPTQAAVFTDTLSAAGFNEGVGEIHPDLYAVATGPDYGTSFTDITSGSNGAYSAATGYDEVTGWGAPRWLAIVGHFSKAQVAIPLATNANDGVIPLTVATLGTFTAYSAPVVGTPPTNCDDATSTTPPTSATLAGGDGAYTVSVEVKDSAGTCFLPSEQTILDRAAPRAAPLLRLAAATKVVASWSAVDPAPSSGASVYQVGIGYPGGGHVYNPGITSTTSYSFLNPIATKYTLNVVPHDPAGNVGANAAATLLDDSRLSYNAGWTVVKATGYFRGSRHVTTVRGAATTVSGTGSLYVAYVTTCAACGKLAVYNGNTLLHVYSLTTNRTHVLVPITLLSTSIIASRNLSLRATYASATARSVQIDAAVVR